MRILLIQLRRIGDVIVTTPAVDQLRRAFPDARIEFLVEPAAAPVLEGYPGLDEALVFDKRRFLFHLMDIRRRRYDWVLDFLNNPRTAQLAWFSGARVRAGFSVPFWGGAYTVRISRPSTPTYAVQSKFDLLRALGLKPPASALPRIPVREADFAGLSDWWAREGLDSFPERVGLVPDHRHPIRRWPAERFSETAGLLLRKPGRALVLLGSPDEQEYLRRLAAPFQERVFVSPRTSLRQAAALLSRCHAAVTNDGGLMHLAVAVGAPTVTVYGPTWPGSWNPRTPPHRWVQAEGLSCVGCNLDRCPYNHECMEWVSAGRVAREVEEVLAGRAVKGASA